MIDKKILSENVPSSVGTQIHINHVGCPSGEDRKKRLYIKRTDTGVVAFCHHCGEKGFLSLRKYLGFKSEPYKSVSRETKPTGGVKFVDLSIFGKIWLKRYHALEDPTFFMGVLENKHQVALYIYNEQKQFCGVQIRNLVDTPKYISVYFPEHEASCAWFAAVGNKTLVITEDYLSAYRVHQDTPYCSLALLRTTLTDKTLKNIYDMQFDCIFIWLDPDKPGVKGARKIEKTLRTFLPDTTEIVLLHETQEAKEKTPTELKSSLVKK